MPCKKLIPLMPDLFLNEGKMPMLTRSDLFETWELDRSARFIF